MGNNICHSSIHSANTTRPLPNIHCRNRTYSEYNEYYYHRESVMANVRLIMLLYFIQASLVSFCFPMSRLFEG
jgi:hypothetical protein